MRLEAEKVFFDAVVPEASSLGGGRPCSQKRCAANVNLTPRVAIEHERQLAVYKPGDDPALLFN
jgi:hypothetical protein